MQALFAFLAFLMWVAFFALFVATRDATGMIIVGTMAAGFTFAALLSGGIDS